MKNHEQVNDGFFSSKETSKYTEILVGFLLLLRISIGVIRLFVVETPLLLASSYEAVTFLTIVTLIVINRERLFFFKIDRASCWIIILGGTIFRTIFIGEPLFFSLLYWIAAIGLFYVLRKTKVHLQRSSIWWLPVGLLVGSIFIFVLSLLNGHRISIPEDKPGSFMELFIPFTYYLFHSAILEEPVFRGFLWGALQMRGIPQRNILFCQAVLFGIAHINYLHQPFVLLVQVPVLAIVFGLLVWKSGSIAPALMAHATYNTWLGTIFTR